MYKVGDLVKTRLPYYEYESDPSGRNTGPIFRIQEGTIAEVVGWDNEDIVVVWWPTLNKYSVISNYRIEPANNV